MLNVPSMSTRDELMDALRKSRTSDFVSEYMFDKVPHVFGDNRTSFVRWKDKIARKLEVDPAALVLVGTSALGMSLRPGNEFKPFNEGSDVDVAVISYFHFVVAWRYLRGNGHVRARLNRKMLIAWDDHVNRLIYWGTIATDKLLGLLPFGRPWLQASTAMAREEHTFNREIRFRVYADFDALRAYQTISVKRAQEKLLEPGGEEEPCIDI